MTDSGDPITPSAQYRSAHAPSMRGARAARWLQRHAGILLVLALALLLRLWLLDWWSTGPQADEVNILNAAQALQRGSYPEEEKRLPLFPLLVAAGSAVPGTDPLLVARGISLLASLATLALVAGIARRLGASRTTALVAPLFLLAFRPFLTSSIRGYADLLFSALVLGALTAVLALPRRGFAAATGLLLGLLAITRYDGATVGIPLALLALARLRRARRAIPWLVGVAVIPPLLYVSLNAAAGRPLLPAVYLEEASSTETGAASLPDLLGRLGTLWERLGLFEAWFIPRNLLRDAFLNPTAPPGRVLDLFREPLQTAALLAIPGLFWLVLRRRGFALLATAATFAAVSVPFAWWIPNVPRYDALTYPAITIAAAAGTAVLTRLLPARAARAAFLSLVFALLLGVSVPTHARQTLGHLQKSRGRGFAEYAALRAAARRQGRVAYEQRSEPAKLVIGPRGYSAADLFPPDAPVEARWAALRRAAISSVVAVDAGDSPFAFLRPAAASGIVREHARIAPPLGSRDPTAYVVYALGSAEEEKRRSR